MSDEQNIQSTDTAVGSGEENVVSPQELSAPQEPASKVVPPQAEPPLAESAPEPPTVQSEPMVQPIQPELPAQEPSPAQAEIFSVEQPLPPPAPTEPIPPESSPVQSQPESSPAPTEPIPTQPGPIQAPPSAQAEAKIQIPNQVRNDTGEPPKENIISSLLRKAKEKIFARKQKKLEKIAELAKLKGKITNDDVQKLLRISDATASRYLA